MVTIDDREAALKEFALKNNLPLFSGHIFNGLLLAGYSDDNYRALIKEYSQARPVLLSAFLELNDKRKEAGVVFLIAVKVIIDNKDPHGFLTNIRKANLIANIYSRISYNFVTTQKSRVYETCFKYTIKNGEEIYIPASNNNYAEFIKVVKIIGTDKERSLSELNKTISNSAGVWREGSIIAAEHGFDDIAALFS